MPMGSVLLRPGVNTQATPSLNEAGVSQSQLTRYQQGLIQKYGGWQTYFPSAIGSTVRDLHPWQGIAGDKHLAVGATQSLSVITLGSNNDITPQTSTRDFAPAFSVSSGSNRVTIVDAGSSTSIFDNVFFNTQISIGTIILSGGYQVSTVGGSSSYTILATQNSCMTVASSGFLPTFTTTANSAVVTVTFPFHNYTATPGLFQQFIAPTTVFSPNVVIQGPYQIASVIDTTSFTINLTVQASAATTVTMNASLAQLVYYRTLGPLPAGSGYGLGGYGLGGYGTGVSAGSGSTGTPITATDWTMDNWGEVLIACPEDGPIYTWSANSGFTTADVITEAPFFNGGIFIAMPQQILVAWRSCQSTGVQDPLRVRWSDQEDFTTWTVSNQTTAGSFRIPTGSRIIGGMQAPTQGIISTDIDVWVMQFVGGTVTFRFNHIGAGCGWISPHCAGVQGGNVFWCGGNNFFMLSGRGVQDIPCPVWDFFFQNLDTANQLKVQCAPNSMFNEIAWFFPSATSAGECDSYVKLNTGDGAWDYGTLSRTAWTDASIVGNAIGSDTTGFIYQHDLTNDAGGIPMAPFFQSGFWRIQDGNDLAFVDFIIPDMKFGTFSGSQGASVQITFFVVDYLGDTPRQYGPYTFTSTTEYINVRFRGRFMAVKISSQDSGSFWRIGRIAYRWAPSGRR